MTALVEIEELTASYGRGPILRGVSLSVQPGDILGLVGESGCGKTTLGMAMLGLLPATATVTGRVTFEGRDLLSMPARARRSLLGDRLASVPQSSSGALDPVYTIGDQLIETFRTHRQMSRQEARELAVRWLKHVGIPSPETRMSAYPHELSGGTRQRVAIAAALALNPSLLIADEPTSALDVTIQAQVLRLLQRLIHEHSGTVILITHDLGVVARLCNRVAVMYAGQIVEEAPVGQLFARPDHPYTRALLASHPALAERGQRLSTIGGRVPAANELPVGCSFQPRCSNAREACFNRPPWIETSPGHYARCVLYEESDASTAS
ncbi:MAG: dppD [Chloroflexi bacterium]|nr:dppD [Chloroflexota bacterium]